MKAKIYIKTYQIINFCPSPLPPPTPIVKSWLHPSPSPDLAEFGAHGYSLSMLSHRLKMSEKAVVRSLW